jgi:hypothetical protein
MNARYVSKPALLAALACALSAGPATLAGGPPLETTVAEIVLYAIDADTNELLRYSFSNDNIVSMGPVSTASGTKLEDMEGLSYVSDGQDKGLYTVPTKGSHEGHLVHIDPLSGLATPFGPNVVASDRKLTGMIAEHDPGSDTWSLLAAEGDNVKSDPNRIEPRRLIRINPRTGISWPVATLTDGRRFEGLARDSKGDAQPKVDVPGVGNGWTKDGALFVFDDNSGRFGVLNPNDGSFVEYLVNGSPSTFATDDAEGMILLTIFDDPLFGTVDGFD